MSTSVCLYVCEEELNVRCVSLCVQTLYDCLSLCVCVTTRTPAICHLPPFCHPSSETYTHTHTHTHTHANAKLLHKFCHLVTMQLSFLT